MHLSSNSANFRLLLFTAWTVLGFACAPPNGTDGNPRTQVSSLTEKEASCENKLHTEMANHSLIFRADTAPGAEFTQIKAPLLEVQETSYGIKKVKNQATAILLDFRNSAQKPSSFLHYDLSVNTKESANPMSLTISLRQILPKLSRTISQNFSITEKCKLILKESSLTKISKTENGLFSYSKSSFFADGGKSLVKKSFELPSGAKLLDLEPVQEDIKLLNQNSYIYADSIGTLSGTLKSLTPKTMQEFGTTLQMQAYEVELTSNGKALVKAQVYEDLLQGFQLTRMASQETWKIPKVQWDAQHLGTTDGNSNISSLLQKDYLLTHSSLQLVTSETNRYEHFAAYWKISNQTFDTVTRLYTFTITENPTPVIAGKWDSRDLDSNDTIQTQLPKIQTIAGEIRKQALTDRKAQIELILKYLSDHYQYDLEMLKNNTIRSLTTQEALERGKGVCQHYAVLFSALARALGIPSRIIMGYLLSGENPGAHAWVEAEVEPGLWQVIEPQRADGLTQTKTRFYLPMSRALFLENKEANQTDSILQMLENYTLKPL